MHDRQQVPDRASGLQAIRAGTMIEIGLALVLLVSIFGMLDPNGD